MLNSRPSSRDLRVDLFRGLALIFIFWDHIPGSVFGELTLRNIGFSDAAELFVFLSGFSATIAYGKRLQRTSYLSTSMHILRRAWVLYIAHVFVLTQLMAMLLTVNDHVLTRDFVKEAGLQYFLDNPKQALVASTLLSFRPGLMDPLPLYIVLLAMMVVALPALMRYPKTVFALSGGLYLAATCYDWNFQAQPAKVWFFNPLTWQFLFFTGAVLGAHRETCARSLISMHPVLRRGLFISALLFLVIAFVVVLSWRWPTWHDSWMPIGVAQWLYPISKTNLAAARLFHFLALVVVVALWVPQGAWLHQGWARALRVMGQHSLPVFCSSVMLSPMADALNAIAGDGVLIQMVSALGGVLLLWLVAQLLEWYRRDDAAAKIAAATTV